ncbi:MAG: UPF0104 family protein [Acidimicrobiia bacterium]|nr:UPF0104 family protein [Acidimicrobiia bacterium]
MGRRTALILAVGTAVFLAYAGLLTWILASRDLPPLGVMGFSLVATALPVEFAAKWLFGVQFQDGVARMGKHLDGRSAFRAALIGAGVARLLPAGGAVTPAAMSWSVRSQVRGTAGAAVRATTLNYAGLLIGTGGFLLWIAYRERILPEAVGAAAGVGAVALVVGGILMFGSSRLGTLVRMLPAGLRRRLEPAFEDHAADGRAQLLLWSRLACEAAVLGLVALAFGIPVTPAQVFAAFGMSQLAGGLPGTPGGLGFAEAGLVGTLLAFGVSTDESLAATLVYRMVSYWMPVAVGLVTGGMAFLGTRDADGVHNGPPAGG